MNTHINQLTRQPQIILRKLEWLLMSVFSPEAPAPQDNTSNMSRSNFAECNSSILSIIESNIIPRLLQSKNTHPSESYYSQNTRPLPSKTEIEAFALICIGDDELAPEQFTARLMSEGLTKENIFLDLITPAARYLGLQWELNKLDFYLVTHGLVQLHSVTHALGYSYLDGPVVKGETRRIMIASAPGSEHILGPSIVSEFFRSEGWQVVLEISPSSKELIQAVSNEWFDAVGISISIQAQLFDLSSLIDRIKKSSRNPNLPVMLGGPIFTIQHHNPSEFGAAAICIDAKEAVNLARSLLLND